MIFGRKKKRAEEADDRVDQADADEFAADDDAAQADGVASGADVHATGAARALDDDPEDGDSEDDDSDDDPVDDASEGDDSAAESDEEADRWAAFDRSKDWREDGPFDINEVDLDADEVERLDFGALVVTPMPDCEIRLQVTEDTQQIIAALIVKDESALELSAYAAPRTPGMWAEIREEIITGTQAAGGTADCIEGPFGTELVRNLPVQTPEGQLAFQPSRTWVAEGPRWLLRGVLFGQAALTDEHDDDLVGPFFDAFSDVIVRRGDAAMPVGDVLPLTLPEELQTAQEQAHQEPPAQEPQG